MNLADAIIYVKSYVDFKAQGGFPERFLNLCRKNNICLFNMQNIDDVIYASASIKDYKRIREPARKSGMKVRIVKKNGLRFFLRNNKNRLGLLVGTAAFFITIFILSSFLWSVSITGCETMNEEEILLCAKELGLREGVFLKKINIGECEKGLSKKFSDISWVGINIKGSCANIEIVERKNKIPKREVDRPSNIVARKDGQIISLDAYSGTKMQKKNSAILKGDILISGITENRDGTNKISRARGYVTALTSEEIENSFMKNQSFKRIDSIKEKSEIFFFFLKIPIKRDKIGDSFFSEENHLKLNSRNMPIGISSKRTYVLMDSERGLQNNEDILYSLDGYFEKFYSQTKHASIQKSNTKLQNNRISTTVIGKLSLLENICEEKLLNIEEN